MVKLIGLTGGIASGKSTTSALFADEGISIFDADACVHKLYQGELVPVIDKAFPGVVIDGRVDRESLSAWLQTDRQAFSRLNALVHPHVEQAKQAFIDKAQRNNEALVVLDIPLLFERNQAEKLDKIVLAWVDTKTQKQRAMKRSGMTEAKFEMILAQQISLDKKRALVDHIIDTGKGLDSARAEVKRLLAIWG